MHRHLAAAAAVADDARPAAGCRVVAVAPVRQRDHDRPEVDALLGQVVLEALRALLIEAALEDAVVDESLQAVGEHVAGDAEIALEVLEAADAEERVAQQQDRPAVAEDLERAGDGAVLGFVRAGQHGSSPRRL